MQFLSQTLDRGLHGGDVVVIGFQLGPCGSARFGIFVVGFDLPRPPLQLPSSLAHSDPRAGRSAPPPASTPTTTASGRTRDRRRPRRPPPVRPPLRDVWPGAPGTGQLAPFSSGSQLALAWIDQRRAADPSGRPSSSGAYGGVGREDLRLTVPCQAVIAGPGSAEWSWLRVHPRCQPVRLTPQSPGRGLS
jgi:hypothetical protein